MDHPTLRIASALVLTGALTGTIAYGAAASF